jgi:hypothetical protein
MKLRQVMIIPTKDKADTFDSLLRLVKIETISIDTAPDQASAEEETLDRVAANALRGEYR